MMEQNDGKRRKPTRKKAPVAAAEQADSDDGCLLSGYKGMSKSAWDATQEKKGTVPDEFSSLWKYANFSGRLVRVDDDWFQTVHGDGSLDTAWTKLRKLMTDPLQSPTSGKLIMDEVHNTVAMGLDLLGPDVGTFVYPGPMALPLTMRLNRLVAPDTAATQYWLTEKSDGVRTMMYVRNVKHPRWLAVREGVPVLLSLYDTLLLEKTFATLVKKKQTMGRPGMPLSKDVRGCESLALRIDEKTNTCYLVDSKKQDYLQLIRSQRDEGLGLAYVFDRSCDVFLLLDEVTLPCETALIDGELIHNLKTDNTEYIMYDIVQRGDAMYSTSDMAVRIEAMNTLVLERNQYLNSANLHPVINMRVKHFYPTTELDHLLRLIVKVGDKYVYNDENYNDGVVLTPDAGHLMPFRPGTCNALLKWKQPEALTADWHVQLAMTGPKWREFKLSYNIKDKTPRGEQYEEHVPYTTAPLLAAKGVELSNESQVVEAKYEAKHGYWKVQSIREDKTTSNSYITIASVLESQAENYTAETLQKALLGESLSTQARISKTAFTRPYCCFVLRSNKDGTSADPHARRLTLQVRCKTTHHRVPRSFSYVPVSETFGLDCTAPVVDKTSALEHLLFIEVANRGGSLHWSDCVCNCKFDPAIGRWEILSVNTTVDSAAVKNHATVKGVLQHLEEVCRYGMSKHTATLTGVEPMTSASVPSNAHYAAKALDTKLNSGRSCLRFFNNWVKSVSISEYAVVGAPEHVVSIEERDKVNDRKLVAVDLCSGRGGDLLKWAAQRPRMYVAVDSCLEAVGSAAKRYSDMYPASMNNKNRTGMPAKFLAADSFSLDGRLRMQAALGQGGVRGANCVSCQFSLHYAFEKEESVHTVLKTVSSVMADGGVFFGTIVDSEVLLKRRAAHGDTFGNSVYSVAFKGGDSEGLYGQKYTFNLESCVENEDEFVVHWDSFVTLAAEYGLVLHSTYNFEEFYNKFISNDSHKEKWNKIFANSPPPREGNQEKKQKLCTPNLAPTSPNMGPADPNSSAEPSLLDLSGSLLAEEEETNSLLRHLTTDECEAAFVYKVFAFTKVPTNK